METLSMKRSSREAVVGPDPSWRSLYRVGGICAVLAGVFYIVALVLNFIMPPTPLSGAAATLQYIASHL